MLRMLPSMKKLTCKRRRYGEQLNTNFIAKRLQDLPEVARSILAWASLLGSTFSFTLIQRLLSGEFDYSEADTEGTNPDCSSQAELFTRQPVQNAVEGLQATLSAYILMPGSNEEEFSFSHNRFVQASASLQECHVEKMHFIIVQTIMKYSELDGLSLYERAHHICQAANVIKRRVQYRHHYRLLLVEAAQKAIESGAKPTALDYYETCLVLMPKDPWELGAPDTYYEESLDVYTKAAELYWHQGKVVQAQNLLDSIFAGARTVSDKASAWILQSKLFAQAGNMDGAFSCLKTSLLELGLDVGVEPTWNLCDQECLEIRRRLQATEFSHLAGKPLNTDSNMIAMGRVLIEATSAAFWSNTLLVCSRLIFLKSWLSPS